MEGDDASGVRTTSVDLVDQFASGRQTVPFGCVPHGRCACAAIASVISRAHMPGSYGVREREEKLHHRHRGATENHGWPEAPLASP
jgi:hypothetical protein